MVDSIKESKIQPRFLSNAKGSVETSPEDKEKSKSESEDEDSPVTRRPLFHNFSAKTLKRNTSYATTLVKNYDKTRFRKTSF